MIIRLMLFIIIPIMILSLCLYKFVIGPSWREYKLRKESFLREVHTCNECNLILNPELSSSVYSYNHWHHKSCIDQLLGV